MMLAANELFATIIRAWPRHAESLSQVGGYGIVRGYDAGRNLTPNRGAASIASTAAFEAAEYVAACTGSIVLTGG